MIKKSPLIIELLFIIIAFLVYFLTSNIFFIFNFLYIGTAITIGLYMLGDDYKYARNFIMLAIGSYLLFYVGIMGHENISLFGFWYYLSQGVFEAAVIHFLIAKILGPFVFGRGWCGYACWTAMILDLLSYKHPQDERKNWGYVRYILFVVILAVFMGLWMFKVNDLADIVFYLFVVGNLAYYIVGVVLAYILKDNRAFCKYVCPITVFLKPASYFSLLRVKVDEDKCNECGVCVKNCMMDVDVLDNSRKRHNATECILCAECIKKCPKDAINF